MDVLDILVWIYAILMCIGIVFIGAVFMSSYFFN